MHLLTAMIFPAILTSVAQLRKDTGSWIGSGGSIFATIAAKDGFLPTTLEAWLAVVLTSLTICYMVAKVVFLVKGKMKKEEVLEDI